MVLQSPDYQLQRGCMLVRTEQQRRSIVLYCHVAWGGGNTYKGNSDGEGVERRTVERAKVGRLRTKGPELRLRTRPLSDRKPG
eukprot:5956006-Lingulodinium_polyedra.AAC.1